MTEIQRKGNRVRRILETKKQPPEYQRLDLEPKEGGRSLLHDEFGIPKVSPTQKKASLPEAPDIPNEPVHVKASVPSTNIRAPLGVPKRGAPIPSDDDGFVPPPSNFVAVGQKDHTWYAPEVTGPRPPPVQLDEENEIIDNNDDVDIESLQGADPFADLKEEGGSEIREQFEKTLAYIEEQALALIYSATTLEELDKVKGYIFGKDSDLTAVLREFKNIPVNERRIVGEVINYAVENLKLEITAKAKELSHEDPAPEPSPEEDEDEDKSHPDDKSFNPPTAKISSLQDGHYAIFIDDKLFNTAPDVKLAREILSRLILGNNIDITRIQVIRRIPIDFGVVLGD